MRRCSAIIVFSLLSLPSLEAAAPRGCVASVPVGSFHLALQPAPGGPSLPIRKVNAISAGQKILYRPVQLPAESKKKAKVALVLVPAERSGSEPPQIRVLDPRPAGAPAEWVVPLRTSVVGLVFGPQGLDTKRVRTLVKKDEELISQLADYAEQTAQMEALVETLAAWDAGTSPGKNLEAALSGFSSAYGASVPKLDRSASTEQQAITLVRALNPALSSYDPLAADPSARMMQSAGLAASVAALFFGSPVGLAAGGAAMFQNMRSMMFPGTDFRSALAQSTGQDGVTLCAKRQAGKSRTRLAYLWAVRVPDAAAPALAFSGDAHLPAGIKSAVPLDSKRMPDWRLVERIREWQLVAASNGARFPVAVAGLPQAQSLEIDLGGFAGPPGSYRLTGKWDWENLEVQGNVEVHTLDGLGEARIAADSSDRLVEGAGRVAVRLEGPDFEFLEKASLRQAGDRNPAPVELEFALPKGRRQGPQQGVEIFVDAGKLKAGRYVLALLQSGGATHEIPLRILPPPPRLANLPLRANQGEGAQRIVLRGSGLDRIESIAADGLDFELGPASAGGSVREISVRLGEGARRGDLISLRLAVEGVQRPIELARAIEVAGPRPKITAVKGSLPGELGIALKDGELAADSFVSFSIRIDNLEGTPALQLYCDGAAPSATPPLRPGEKRGRIRMETAGEGVLFLSFDPAAVGKSGCAVTAVVETDAAGRSDALTLGRVVRLPRIESFTLTDEKVGDSAFAGVLKGQHLETIAKAGWNSTEGLAVESLPAPVAGEGDTQTLKIALPWPSPTPHAALYIWLRGEEEGRATQVRY